MGPSGSGKTSLLRAMAGLWKTGTGKVTYSVKGGVDPEQSICSDVDTPVIKQSICSDVDTPVIKTSNDTYDDRGKSISRKSSIFFLPQKPYMVLGTLRQQLLYPTWADGLVSVSDSASEKNVLPFLTNNPNSDNMSDVHMKPTSDELIKVLEDVRLGYLLARFSLDSTHEWSSVLSLGEQQRLAFARLLLSKPQLILLDESTSALDEDNEVHLYQKIAAAGITYISVGHRSTLYDYHSKVLRISTLDSKDERPNWCIEPSSREPSLK